MAPSRTASASSASATASAPVGERARRIEKVQAQGREHLIVARPARVQASSRRADALRQAILDRRLAILLVERDAPSALRVLLADGGERAAYRLMVRRRQKPLLREHVGVRRRGRDVVGHQTIVEQVVLARGVGEHALVERNTLVPQARHEAAVCSAGESAFRSATTSVPVPSFVNTSASRLSVDL